MNVPTSDQFSEFYQAAHGYAPFPWQERVAARVCAGNWPRVIALPTAAGKTACLDIAVFALACRAKEAPRRIFLVVDRRIVVDQAWLHAKDLAKVLKNAKAGILRDVADSLRDIAQISKNVQPLDVYALRGGMYRETAWVRSPLQPTIIASTVDQVGSRLLFRGYGVSDSMKPIHAGLVGNDAIILLDEAHCSRPFDQTMQAIEKYRHWNTPPAPFRFVSITATPNGDIPESEIERDQEDDRSHPVLGKRIAAAKPATLIVAEKAKGKNGITELVKVLEKWAHELATPEGCVGIIVNRVATARELKKSLGENAVLLTGRMRPIDRDRLLREKLGPLLSNAEGVPPTFVIGTQCLEVGGTAKTMAEASRLTFVIGTQCLEVGADFDFHALVTECASLDALRQRFGRLNRVARRREAKAVVVIRGDQTEPKENESERDPIYGNSLPLTWKWLNANKDGDTDVKLPWIDFGVASIRRKWDQTPVEQQAEINAPSLNAPVLFPAHLDCWVQTSPIPMPDPDPAIFLHGPNKGASEVQVVFRDDLGGDVSEWAKIVALRPPSSSESVPVRIGVFKKWLAGESVADTSGDVEGEPEEASEFDDSCERNALRWQGPTSRPISEPGEVRPNALYVLPTEAPDNGQLGDFPSGPDDVGDEAFQLSRDKAILRLRLCTLNEDADDFDERLTDEIRSLQKDKSPDWLTLAVEHLANPKNRDVDRNPSGGWVVTGKRRLGKYAPEFLDDGESSYSPVRHAVTLGEHSLGVAAYARRFADACGLDAETFALAGSCHDLGKLDPRFQRLLNGYSGGPPLAKSGTFIESDPAVHQYPRGGRHEFLSAAMVATKTDDDLLLHLVATHHGGGRPFAEPLPEIDTVEGPLIARIFDVEYELDSYAQKTALWNAELPQRFWRVVRRFGWWGTAYREAIFRLADHAQSREEQEPDPKRKEQYSGPVPPLPSFGKPQRLYKFPLPGLDGANPTAFLAALGTLRLADELFPGALLGWEQSGRWQPALILRQPVSFDDLVERFHRRVHRTVDANASNVASEKHKEYRRRKKEAEKALELIKDRKLRGKERETAMAVEVSPLRDQERNARQAWLKALESAAPEPFLSLGKSIAVTAAEFERFALHAAERLHDLGEAGRTVADFAPAFGCESCADRNGRVIPTEFQLITGSGHQFFLDTFGTLMASITVEQIHRALSGPWKYEDSRLSFRWDPLDDRRYAYAWNDPSDEEVRTEHGANLLAAFGLPLLPVIPTSRGPVTTGFQRDSDSSIWTWPLWRNPSSVDVVRSLLAVSDVVDCPFDRYRAMTFGVSEAFRVRKIEVGRPPLSKLNLTFALSR